MNIYLKKTLSGLKPIDQESEDNLKKIKIGETRLYKVTKPRNYKYHQKYFVLLNLVLLVFLFY